MPVPPETAQREAQRGLDWRREFGRGGTPVGIARARDISNGVDLSMDTVRRMSSYFARHEVDKQGEGWSPDEPGYPSNGRIAWALWGGDSARAWADELIAADDTVRTQMDANTPETHNTAGVQEPAIEPLGDPVPDTPAPLRYTVLEAEQRRVGGRDVEFRTVETGALEIREAADESAAPTLRGYAAVFDSPSEPLPFIETIAPGAFKRSLNSGREVRAFVNHNTDAPLATTKNGSLSLGEDQRGLLVEMSLPNTTQGRDLAELVRSGVVHSWSFGFSVPSGGDTWLAADERQLREVILHEVSIVTGFPAYPATEGAQVRTADEPAVEAPGGLPLGIAQRMFELNAKR